MNWQDVFSPERRVAGATVLLVISLVGWPLSALTIFSDEPQGILGLSWLAITFTAVDILATTDTRREVDDEQEDT